MIKHRIMSAATLLGGVVFTGHAVAQSPEVARRLDAKYDVVWPAADGLIRVNKGGYRIPDSRMKSNGKYGYADTLGQVVVPPAYDDAADFGNGHAVVGRKAGDGRMLYGLIDRSGRVVVPCNFYSAEEFLGDRAVVSKVVAGGKLAYGYIDRSGKEVIPCQFDMASGFRFANTWVGMEQDGEYTYTLIGPNGETVLPFRVGDLQDGGKYGHAAASISDAAGRKRFGIVANNGKVILPFEYEDQDAVDDDYLRRLHAHGFRRTVVVDERVDRVLDGDVVLQRLDVVDQHLRVERLRMVVIEFRAFLVGQLGVRLVIVVVAERHDVVAYEGLLQAFDERGLSRAGSSGDSDYGNFHSVSL